MKHITPSEGWKGIKENWRNDFIAAISVALVALPLGLGIASTSGFEPIAGVLSIVVGATVATFFRGGYLSINGPGAGLIAAVLAAVTSLGGIEFALAAIVVSGGIQVLIGLLKMGKFAEVFPSSVIHGILAAIGVIIISKELYYGLLGGKSDITKPLDAIANIAYEFSNFNPFVICIFGVGILLLLFHSKISYKLFHFLPAPMWVLVITIPFVYLFNFFDTHQIEFLGQHYEVGKHLLIHIPDNLSDCILHPDFSKINTFDFWLAVFSITLIGTITSLVCAKATDKLDPYKRKTDLDKDLIGVGLATMASGALGGLPIMAVIIRSTVNVQNNAKTKFSNLYHAILLLFFVLILTPFIQQVPRAALAAILVFTGFKLAAPRIFRQAYERGMEQLIFLVTTLVITLLTDQLWGILGGIAMTLTIHLLLARVSVKGFYNMIFKQESKLVKIGNNEFRLKLEGIVNFLTLIRINKLLAQIPMGSKVVIDGRGARLVDLTVLETFEDFVRAHIHADGLAEMVGFDGHITSSDHRLALKSKHSVIEKPLTEREKRIQKNAQKYGWTYSHMDDSTRTYLEEFQFFETRPLERRSNIITGTYSEKEIEWEIGDVIFDEGALHATEVYNTTVEVIKLPFAIPKFIIEKEGLWDKFFDKIKALSGYKDIDFQLFPDFSKKFLLEGEDEAAIRQFFNKNLIQFLENHEIYHIESNGEALLIFRHFRFAHSDEMIKMVEFSEELIDNIEAQVMV